MQRNERLLQMSAFIISFAGAMLAIRSFLIGRPGFGGYDLAIAGVALLTFIAARARQASRAT